MIEFSRCALVTIKYQNVPATWSYAYQHFGFIPVSSFSESEFYYDTL